jgi:cation-transporting P-type ATPase D
VKRYYGGREISEEDLESALQVGMRPIERRRYEKKRGVSFKHSIGNAAAVPEGENHADGAPRMSNVDTLNVDTLDGSYANEETRSGDNRQDDSGKPSLTSDLAVDKATSNGNTILIKTTDDDDDGNDEAVNDESLNRRQPNVVSDLSDSRDEESLRDEDSTQAKHHSKLSLLGHGPHGKQVVDHLLKEYGEDGVREFCQRWRQVFVDALKPRFLPGGWDVKHRYATIIYFPTLFVFVSKRSGKDHRRSHTHNFILFYKAYFNKFRRYENAIQSFVLLRGWKD